MNIVFFGTSDFVIPSLRELIASRHKVLALVTQPDKARGRNLKLSPPPAKVLALQHGIPVHQPKNASCRETESYLRSVDPDLFIVVSYGQILKANILSIPKHFTINLHGSLLPQYRGASPTNRAIMNGDRVSGVTIMRLNERMDEGDIMLKCEAGIDPDDTNITLTEKLAEIGATTLLQSIDLIESGKAQFEKQDPSKVTYAPKLKKEDGLIDWRDNAKTIHNKVRGLLPWPGAYTHYDGRMMKVLKTDVVGTPSGRNEEPGTVIDIVKDKGIIVKTGDGCLAIQYLQLEGKTPLDFAAFLRGHKLNMGYKF